LIVVVEPGRRSIDTAEHIRRLAAEIRLNHIAVVGNKIRSAKDEDFLRTHLPDFEFLGFMPYDETLIEADLNGVSPFDTATAAKQVVAGIIEKL
jgi:CO dehydrogenase maturation factor